MHGRILYDSSWVPGCIRGGELDLTLLPCLLRRSYDGDYYIMTSVRVMSCGTSPSSLLRIYYLCSPQPMIGKNRHLVANELVEFEK